MLKLIWVLAVSGLEAILSNLMAQRNFTALIT